MDDRRLAGEGVIGLIKAALGFLLAFFLAFFFLVAFFLVALDVEVVALDDFVFVELFLLVFVLALGFLAGTGRFSTGHASLNIFSRLFP